MDLDEKELALLDLLAEEWEKAGPPGFVETTIIAERLKISVGEAKSTIRSLFVKGIAGTDKLDTYAAYLTPEGFDMARSRHLIAS